MKMQIFVIFEKKNSKNIIWKIKNIVKLEIIAIIQENIEILHIAYVIQNTVFQKNFYGFSYWIKV